MKKEDKVRLIANIKEQHEKDLETLLDYLERAIPVEEEKK